jgi:hypothetical protein
MAEPEHLELARKHLVRVQVAAHDPVDSSDLYIYGFLTLENAVVAAADHFGIEWKKTHPSKAEVADELHRGHGLADVSGLLRTLNDLRKAESYGEAATPIGMTAEQIAVAIEAYVESVGELLRNP